MSHFSLNNEQENDVYYCYLKKLSCFLAKNWESEAIGRDATARTQTVQLPFSFSQNVFPLFPIECRPIPNPLQVAWTQRKRSTSQTRSSQHGGYYTHANTDWLEVCVSVRAPVSWSLLIISTTGHLFILQRHRNTCGFIKLCFPPADCCDWTIWMTTKIIDEKKWVH